MSLLKTQWNFLFPFHPFFSRLVEGPVPLAVSDSVLHLVSNHHFLCQIPFLCFTYLSGRALWSLRLLLMGWTSAYPSFFPTMDSRAPTACQQPALCVPAIAWRSFPCPSFCVFSLEIPEWALKVLMSWPSTELSDLMGNLAFWCKWSRGQPGYRLFKALQVVSGKFESHFSKVSKSICPPLLS